MPWSIETRETAVLHIDVDYIAAIDTLREERIDSTGARANTRTHTYTRHHIWCTYAANVLRQGVVRLCKAPTFFRHPFRGPRFISLAPAIYRGTRSTPPSLPFLGKAHLSREISSDILPACEMSPMRFDISSCVWMGCSLCFFLSVFLLSILLSLSISLSLPRSRCDSWDPLTFAYRYPRGGGSTIRDVARECARWCICTYARTSFLYSWYFPLWSLSAPFGDRA